MPSPPRTVRTPREFSACATPAASGKLKWRETIAEDVEKAPSAFLGMLKGKNFGKQLVKLGRDGA